MHDAQAKHIATRMGQHPWRSRLLAGKDPLRAQVTAWFAPQFAELRRRVCVGGEAAYLASLSRCRPWEARGGKTRSYFAKTCDDRYIVKQLQPSEKRSFPEIAPSYFRYLAHAMRKGLPTCLAKIMGIYTVGARSAGMGGLLATSLPRKMEEQYVHCGQGFALVGSLATKT